MTERDTFRYHLPRGLAESAVYRQAITHRSGGSPHNERLEYLGDAVLGMVVAAYLYRIFPEANEGDLSRLRSYLVRKEMLADIAQGSGLGDELVLGPGELKSGGFRRDTILANALEAVIGAVYLTQDMKDVEAFVLELYGRRLDQLPAVDKLKDPKTRLQELLQARHLSLPEYELVDVTGEAHAQQFCVDCRVLALGVEERAWATSKRKAEQASAEKALAAIKKRLEGSPRKNGLEIIS